MYDQFVKRKTRGSLEPESLSGSNLYLTMTIVHFIMVLTKNQLIIILLRLKFKQIKASNKAVLSHLRIFYL